mgnify:CR=1 FL=1
MKTILPILRKTISINTLIVVLCLVIYSIGVNATVRYVKPVASGMANGSSWANSSDDIQTMINASTPGDSVWVAAGEYKPNSYPLGCIGCINSRYNTFYIKDGVRLFGNFNGTETDISQRDFGNNITILSGDLNDDDVVTGNFSNLTISGNGENVHHVILVYDIDLIDYNTIIDGFTIKNGNANVPLEYNVNGALVTMYEGGGIFVQDQNTLITNCFFINNSAFFGGGIFSYGHATTVSNSVITNNVSQMDGGGISFNNVTCEILNSSIIGNKSLVNGGAISNTSGFIEMYNNEIIGNASGYNGGGMYLLGGEYAILNNIITDNYATNNGGAIYHDGTSITISKNIITHNIVGFNGGGLCLSSTIQSINNNVIYNNYAEIFGGGLYIGNSEGYIANNTIIENKTNSNGGGIFVNEGTNYFRNNILWGNWLNTEPNITSADLFLNAGSNTFLNNIIQLDSTLYTGTNYSLGANAQGNLFAQNPLFLDNTAPEGEDLIYLTGDDGLRLQTSSPALNAGTTFGTPTTDILGTTRDAQPDIGAYEHGVFVGIHPNTNSQPSATLNAYPNPATDAITFTFTTPTTHESTLILYSIDGKSRTSLYKATTQAGQTNTLTIDTIEFTPGTYCAVLRCGNGLAQHRTIIIK